MQVRRDRRCRGSSKEMSHRNLSLTQFAYSQRHVVRKERESYINVILYMYMYVLHKMWFLCFIMRPIGSLRRIVLSMFIPLISYPVRCMMHQKAPRLEDIPQLVFSSKHGHRLQAESVKNRKRKTAVAEHPCRERKGRGVLPRLFRPARSDAALAQQLPPIVTRKQRSPLRGPRSSRR